MSDKTEQEESIKEPDINHPKPGDFDEFLPWACKEYRVEADVIVTRGFQEVYVSAGTNKKQAQKRKLSKLPSFVTTQDLASREEYHSSDIDKTVPDVTEKIVNIETVYDSLENLVQVKFLRNQEIPRKVIQILALTIPFQQKLTSVTINSGLRMESLYELSKCLPGSQITELCLDGTTINEANYCILLMHSKLKHLSLARCTLNDSVVKTIADQLIEPCSAAKILSALNLSSNRITDIGAKHLANVLRTNRQLSYLNLASNMIGDEGGMSILNTLQRFPLLAQELLDSRARYIAYSKQRHDLINTFIMELQTTTTGKNNRKKSTKRAKLEIPSMQQHFASAAEAQITLEKAEYLADSKLGSFSEPFSPNNTESDGDVVYCLGNYTLCYLNLAYNHLTYASVKKLLEVLRAQKTLNRTPRGLIKVLIEGNLLPIACDEFEEIDYLLGSIIKSFRRQSEIGTKRRPVSAKSTTR